MATGEVPDTTDGAVKPPDAPPPLRKLPIRARRSAFVIGLFALALWGSWQLRHSTKHDENTEERARPPLKKIEASGNPVESLARGDAALQHHRYAEALSHYEELLAANAAGAAAVDYRLGLCNESLGHLDRAIAAYRKALGSTASPTLSIACQLAKARCLLRQDHAAEARRLVYPFLFDENRQQHVPAVLVADARYLVALSMAHAYLRPAAPALWVDSPISFVAAALEIPLYLDVLGHPGKSQAEPQQTDNKPALKVERSGPALEVLEQLAKDAGWHCEWSAAAQQALADRSLKLALRNWPLLEVLEQAADCLDLACVLDHKVVRLATNAETEPKKLTLQQGAMTARALQAALRVDGSHGWAAAAHLELGNWEAVQDRVAEAGKCFERLIREAHHAQHVGPAYFNLARLHVRKLDSAGARQAFYRVIDHAAGHELALRAQLRIGQLYLDDDNAKEAIGHLRRTQLLAQRSPYQALATLALAAAYLQTAQPAKTQAVLAQQRTHLQKDPYKPTAAFLDAYAQYQLAKATHAGRREASELLSTLLRDQDITMLGPTAYYLMAQAYRDLSLWDQAERLLRQASELAPIPLVKSMEYLLADTLLKQHRRQDAAQLFEKLAATPSPCRARAHFQLAQFDLESKRFQDCVQKCSQLWAEQSFAEPSVLLHLWGAALEGLGDFTKAAQCFAGKAPR